MQGWQHVADNPDMMKKSWEQCGLLEAFNPVFQLEARDMFDANTLFTNQIPAGQEVDPSLGGDEVDEDGNLIAVVKSSKRGRPAGSKNKPSTALGSASTALGSASTALGCEPKEPKKRGRPAGSRNKPKPGELTETAGRGRGRGKGRRRSRRKMVRLYASAESGSSSDSDNAPMQSAAASFSPLSSDCELVDAETSNTSSGADCDAPITVDSSESVEEVSSSDSEKDVHSSEDEYEFGNPDDADPVAARLLMKDPHTTLMISNWSAKVHEQQEPCSCFVAFTHLWFCSGGCCTLLLLRVV